MSPTNPLRPTEGVQAHRLSATRLFGILVLFLILAGYSIWKSERFQNMIQGVSQDRLSAELGVPVSFQTVDLRFFPPTVRLANVRIGNDPRLGLPADRPLFSAEEVSIGGGVSLVSRQLRLGRIRAVRPRILLVQNAAGKLNLPPGLGGPSKQGGLKLQIGSVLVQQGVLEIEGRKTRLNGRLDDFAAELVSLGRDRYRGTVVARRARIELPNAEPLLAEMSLRFQLDSPGGLTVDELKLAGAFGQIRAAGALENFNRLHTALSASAALSIQEVERIFRSDLGFSGVARVEARIEIAPEGGFRITGQLQSPRIGANQFTLDEVTATLSAEPGGLVARIERAGYGGGQASGVFRIGNLTGDPRPMTLALEAEGVSLERFFGDLDLKGTGLSGSAALSVGLRWGSGGLAHANGGGTLRIDPGPASSIVRGRFGLPTAGGAALAVVNGRIGFEGGSFRFPQSTVDFTGGIQIGRWQPDFDLRLRSRDLAEIDRLFQNIQAATGGKGEPLGLAGSGEMQGHLAGRWANPEATIQIAAEEARFAGVAFGSVRGTIEMRDGAFYFRPLHVYDGEASLSLEGMARYRVVGGLPRFGLQVSARDYPIGRLLEYLDLRYPIEGRVTGSFPLSGTPEALTGGGPVELRQAVLWAQKVALLRGSVSLTPGRFAIENLSAAIDGGMVRGSGSLAIREKTFSVRLAGDAVPLQAIEALGSSSKDLSGKLSFQLSGDGALDRPDVTMTATLSEASVFGHPVPDALEPRLEARVTEGSLDASVMVAQHWRFEARGDLFGKPARLDVALDATDLASLFLFTPLELIPGRGGSLAVEGNLTLPGKKGEFPTGSFAVTRARLDLPERPGALATSGAVKITLGQGKLSFQEFRAVGEGTVLKINGAVDLGSSPGGLNVAVSGPLDASLLSLFVNDVALAGKLQLDVRASGTLQKPSLSGAVRIEGGKYRFSTLPLIVDEIDGSVTFQGSRGDIEARAKVRGGETYAAGGFSVEGLALKDFRFSLQARHVSLPYPEDLRLIVDADLVATGGPAGNLLRGEVVLLRGTYSKDFEVTLSDLLARSRPSSAIAARAPWKERTGLEVRIVSSAALEVRNNLARLTATVDLVARGTLADPSLLGQIVLDEGGRITFRDVRYDIESGTITFASTRGFAPILDIRARAEVKGYDLVVNLVGTWPRIQTSFSSDPPLPDETVLGLLLTGATPTGRPETDTTGSIVSAGAGLAAGAATGVFTRPTQKLFKLDRFQIDPVFAGGQLADIRSTVGKQITPNLLVTYSQSFDTSKLPVVQVEWRLSDTVVVRGQRDENGIYLIDIRRRQRL